MAKNDKPFNNPFGALKARAQPAAPQPAAKTAPPPKKKPQASDEDESALFLSAMGAFEPVKPVHQDSAPVVSVAPPDDAESLRELAELVSGDSDLVVERKGASVLACPKGFDAALFGKLPAKAQLDLQALAPDAARQALERFVLDAHAKKIRSLRLVTGPALRDLAIDALTRGRLVRKVLAFSGGPELIDVLLRS